MSLSKGMRLKSATAPLDYRLSVAGTLVRSNTGAPRAGVLYTPSADATVATRSSSALRLTILDQVVLALVRSATDGADIVTNVGALNLDFTAPSANSQYFTVWARVNDSTMGDPNDTAVLQFSAGGAAASPAIPAAPSGATKIGHLLIPAGATSLTSSGVVWTETILGTAPIGSAIRYRTVSEMNADAANLDDGATAYVRSGDEYFLKAGSWRSTVPAQSPTLLGFSGAGSNWGRSPGGTATVNTYTFTSATAGIGHFHYYVIIDSGGANLGGNMYVKVNGVEWGTRDRIATPGGTKASWVHTIDKPIPLRAGSNTVEVVCQADGGSGTIYGNAPGHEAWSLS